MIVVDTNVIASLWVPNDMDELAYRVLKKDPEWVSPALWCSEFRNVMALYLRRDILDLPAILQAMQEAEQLMHSRAYDVNSVRVLSLVSQSGCSSYDCEFVALAKDLGVQLVTFDRKICTGFPEVSLHPADFME